MKKQIITIEITYDDRSVSNPSDWDWLTLLDLDEDENVYLIECETPVDAKKKPATTNKSRKNHAKGKK